MVGVMIAALSLLAATACSQQADASWRAAGSTAPVSSGEAGGTTAKKPAPGEFTVTPAEGATEVSVLDPISVTADQAKLESVTMTNPEGRQIKGELSSDGLTWKSGEDLGYGKEYTVTATGLNSAGEPIQKASKFTTLKPREQTMPYLRASDTHLLKERQTYGVGQTVQIFFDEKVDKATVQKLLKVTTEPETPGGFYWHSAQKVEWRSKEYLKPGTKVSVEGKLYGKDLGNGIYSQGDIGGSFKVGQSKIAKVDANTKQMKVFFDGQMVRQIPISAGKGGKKTLPTGETINYWTNGGPHVVLGKTPSTRMTSSSYGVKDKQDPEYYDVDIKWTVQISITGEYVHRADNHRMFGIANMSHGCVNMPAGQAEWFYENFDRGDVVDVEGTPVRLGVTNGNGAWTLSWEKWQQGSAL